MVYVLLFLLELFLQYLISRATVNTIARTLFLKTHDKRKTVMVLSAIFLPGTFIHEIAHFITALFLLVPVHDINLVPEIDEDGRGVKLGSVPIGRTDLVRESIIGIAPLLIGLGLIFWMIYILSTKDLSTHIPLYLVSSYAVFQISSNMFSSPKDLRAVLELSILSAILLFLGFLVKLKIPSITIPQAFIVKITSLFQTADLYLGIAIAINLSLLISTSLIYSRLKSRARQTT